MKTKYSSKFGISLVKKETAKKQVFPKSWAEFVENMSSSIEC